MKNVHLIPTEKPSRLYKQTGALVLDKLSEVSNDGISINQHLYITSDEEIKEGDYSFYPPFGIGKNIIIDNELCFHVEAKDGIGSFTQRTYQTLHVNKKIILTTDQDLINDGVQAIDDEFLWWFSENPSCEEVEIDKYGYMPDEPYEYKIIIPQEEAKQETLEGAAERLSERHHYAFGQQSEFYQLGFIEGAKWQAERMYSEEEVKEILMKTDRFLRADLDLWFEQFKKK